MGRLARGLPTFINPLVRYGGMDNFELWSFNVFIIGIMVWLYCYFYSLFNAVLEMNDRLISMWNEKMNKDEMEVITADDGQMRLAIYEEE